MWYAGGELSRLETRLDATVASRARHHPSASFVQTALTPALSTTTKATMTDLSALLESSKALTAHLARPDLPSVNLSLDQIEAQSRRLVSRQPATSNDADRAYAGVSFKS